MRKRSTFLLLGSAVACAAIAISLAVASNGGSLLKIRADDPTEYSITITDPLYEGEGTSAVGNTIVKTGYNNDIKLEYYKLKAYEPGYNKYYLDGINCMEENGAYIAIVANGEGHGVAGIKEIELQLDNDTYGSPKINAWYGWSDGDYVNVESLGTSDGDHQYIFSLHDTYPTFAKLELSDGNSGNRVGIHQIKIDYTCEETESPYIVSGDYILTEGIDHCEVNFYTGTGTALTFPSSAKGKPVTRIANNFKCTNISKGDITAVTLPSSVTYIGDMAFYYAQNLTSIDLSNVQTVGDYAFYWANKLETITSLDSIVSVGSEAFNRCYKLTGDLNLPASLTVINSYGFMDTDFTSVTINDAAECNVYQGAFRSIESLESIYIGNSVELFYDDILYNYNLESITVGASNENYESIDNVFYRKLSDSKLRLICIAPNRPETTYNMPNNVTEIGTYCAFGAVTLEEIVFNNSVTTIPDYSFVNCANLASITFGSSIETIQYAFHDCYALTSLHFPSSLREIYQKAFDSCTSLKTVIFEEGCARICGEAFIDCTALDTVILPTTLTDTGDTPSWTGSADLFNGCTALTNVFTRLTSGSYSGEDIRSGWYGARTMNLYSESSSAGCWHFDGSGNPVLW